MTWWKKRKPSVPKEELDAGTARLEIARDMRKSALRQVMEVLEKVPEVDTAIAEIGNTLGKRGPPS